jgi:FkbM family methyltransferase
MSYIADQLGRFPALKNALRPIYRAFVKEPPRKVDVISERLLRACITNPEPTILEIGCNDGSHTRWFLELFSDATIYCFEPDPRAIARFRGNINEPDRVSLFELALSDKDGETIFYQSGGQLDSESAGTMPEGWDLSGSIRKPKDHLTEHDWVTFEKNITIQTRRLDGWCSEQHIQDIDFIWMDVQGAEIDVFKGATEILTRTRFIYTEYSDKELYEGQPTLSDILAFLPDFEIAIQYSGDVLLRNRRYPFEPDAELQYAIDNHMC